MPLRAATSITVSLAAVLAPAFGLSASPAAAAATPPPARSAHAPVAVMRDKLPDMAMLPLTTCTRTGAKPRCKPFHIQDYKGHKLLRFSTIAENQGPGRLEVVASRPNRRVSDLTVVQNIYQTDGRIRRMPTRAVARYASQDGHDHFHVQDFMEMRLRPAGSNNTPRGGHKEGFCLVDDWQHVRHVGEHDHYSGCGGGEPKRLTVKEGITPGFVDDYAWNLWGQNIYLDRLRLPGDFCVSGTVDPRGLFKEKTRSNNTASALVRIASKDARLIRQGC